MLPSPRLVAAARILAEMTQAELAAHAGVSLSAIKRLEAGVNDARAKTVRALVKALRAHGIAFTYDAATNREGIYHRLPEHADEAKSALRSIPRPRRVASINEPKPAAESGKPDDSQG